MKKLLIVIGLALALAILLASLLLSTTQNSLQPSPESTTNATPIKETPAIIEKNGLRFVVEHIEPVSEENENYLAIYVNISNMGRNTWRIEPVKQFTLVFEDGREVKAIGTSLWGGSYYVKPGETIDFYVVFPADSAKPYKLVARLSEARFSEAVIEARLDGVPIYIPVVVQNNVEVLMNPYLMGGFSVEYGRGFIFRRRKFFDLYGPPLLPAPLNPYEWLVLAPLGSTTVNVTMRIRINVQKPAIMKIEYSGSVVSVEPKELLLETSRYVELEIKLKVPENRKPIDLAVTVYVEPLAQNN
ncbi:MAG: hypothetical protein QXL19_07625 [Ignisphaera sp.]